MTQGALDYYAITITVWKENCVELFSSTGKSIINQSISPGPPKLAKRWHHLSVERPLSHFCGVARQPKWDKEEKGGRNNEGGKFEVDGSLTRHLSIHLVLHVRGWRAPTDHPVRGHVVTMRGLWRRSTLVHSTRAHGHILSGRLCGNNNETKTQQILKNNIDIEKTQL